MNDRAKRVAFGALVVAIGAVLLWAYLRFVWYAGPTLAWTSHGEPYELLAPRMLGLVLLVPYFVWMIGRSLADLPLAQRVASVVLRTAFLALLALGLARVARTATTQKVCTVYLVDVSDSVPDASLEDARAEIQKGLEAKPDDALVRVVTFARRPRVVPLPDDAKQMPPIVRHDPPGTPPGTKSGFGAGTDLASAVQLAYGLYPAGYLRRAVLLTDGVQTDSSIP